jgi:hypothetical protein
MTLIEPPSVAMKPATTMPTQGIIGASDSDFLRNRKLGEVLVHMGHLKPQQVDQAVRASQVIGERLGRYLVRESFVTPKILCHALALQSGLPTTDITGVNVPADLIELFTVSTMQEQRILPFDQAKTFICVAVADVLTPKEIRALEAQCGRRIQIFLADEDELAKQIDVILRRRTARKHPRYALIVPVVYQFCSRLGTPVDETVYFVTSVNFSEGGMAIQGVPEAVGTLADTRRQDMYANVIVKALPNEIEARCQVRWVRKSDKSAGAVPKYQIGMEFVEITDENRVRLANLCV